MIGMIRTDRKDAGARFKDLLFLRTSLDELHIYEYSPEPWHEDPRLCGAPGWPMRIEYAAGRSGMRRLCCTYDNEDCADAWRLARQTLWDEKTILHAADGSQAMLQP